MENWYIKIMASDVWIFASHQLTWLSLAVLAIAFRATAMRWFQIVLDRTQVGATDDGQDRILGGGVAAGIFSVLLLMELNLIFSMIVSGMVFFIAPTIIRKRRFKLYQSSFDATLVESLATISSSLKAGLTLKDSLVIAVQNCPPVFGAEVGRVLKDYRFGMSIDEALDGVRKRVQTQNANIAFGALIIGTQLGGKIPEVLSRIVATIREADRVEGRLRALTAQGRAQGFLLCSMPILIGIGMYFMDRPKMEYMMTSTVGKVLLGLVVFLEVVGILATMKVMELEV